MTFEDKLVETLKGKLKIAALYGPSQKAAQKPDLGITIQNKAAYFVIRDCATVAHDYLPLIAYTSTAGSEPYTTFKGVFTPADIADFVNRATTNHLTPARMLLKAILFDIGKNIKKQEPEQKPVVITEPVVDDIYGDYSNYDETPQTPKEPLTTSINIDDKNNVINILTEAFSK